MARRTKEQSEKTQQAILDSAFEVFTQKGFMRTTLNDIALAAGVTRGAVYWHFRDKVDLFMALAEKIEGEAGVRPEDIEKERVRSLEDAREKILNYLAHFEKRDRYAVFYEMVNYRTEYTKELQPVLDKQLYNQQKILAALEKAMGELRSLGKVRSDLDPSKAALSLFAFISGIIGVWLLDPGAFRDSTALSMLFDDFFMGMRPVIPTA